MMTKALGLFCLLSLASVHAQEPVTAICEVKAFSGLDDWPIDGVITLSQDVSDGPTTLEVSLGGFDADLDGAQHGFHVHTHGDLTDNCVSTGSHYNPHGRFHGAPTASERHVGDLGNLVVQNGRVDATLVDDQVSLMGDYSVIGRSMTIHGGTDDLGLGGDDGSISHGNSGPRVACCVIEPTN